MISKKDIRLHIQTAIDNNAEYVMIACDTNEGTYYSIEATRTSFKEKYEEKSGINMHRVIEIYDLSANIEEQVKSKRAFNPPRD